MDTLSRREEEALLKSTKARALKECDQFVKGLWFSPLRPFFPDDTHSDRQNLQIVRLAVPFLLLGPVVDSIKKYKNACCSCG